MNNRPCVQYVNAQLLSSSLNGFHFVVLNGFTKVVVGDMSDIWLANEEAGFRGESVNVRFQLHETIRATQNLYGNDD